MTPLEPAPSRPVFAGTARFEIVRQVGAGAVGLVYEAMDHQYGTRVAIKTLQRLESGVLLRFKNEFRQLQDLHHPNLVRLGELFEDQGNWFFTMEYLDGVDFLSHVTHAPAPPDSFLNATASPTDLTTGDTTDTLVLSEPQASASEPLSARRPGDLDEPRLRASLLQLAEGLMALHDAGKIHRDIKPSNVMVVGERVVILDFGLVHETDDDEAERGLVGTPAYMAPEQAAGQRATPASDWYAVGTMLYEALAGCRPFAGGSMLLMVTKQMQDPQPPGQLAPGVPADLEALCMALLQRDPAQRATGHDILACLGHPRARPRPARARATSSALDVPLYGREPLLARLAQALQQVQPAQPVAVFVQGPSGMGKSALVREFAAEATSQGAVVLGSRCYERESVPYKAFDGVIDALARHLHRLGPAADSAWRDEPALVRIFPVLARPPSPDAPAPDPARDATAPRDLADLRRQAFAALEDLLAWTAARAPLVVVIDDVQWGDLDSAALLGEILAPPRPPGLLLVICHRSEEATGPIVATLRDHVERALDPARIHDLRVAPLDDAEARALARALLHAHAVDPDAGALAAMIAREAAGSPFLVGELVRYLTSHRDAPDPMPASAPGRIDLAQVVARRRLSLPEPARDVLDAIALAGCPISPAVALAAAGRDEHEHGLLDLLRAEHLVRTHGGTGSDAVECHHDRIRELVAAGLDPLTRRDLHRRLAEALEAAGSPDAELLAACHHGAGQLGQAAAHALVAAEQAERCLAFERAARMYHMVLSTSARVGAEPGLLWRRLGDALANAARGGEAAAAYLEAAAAVSRNPAADASDPAADAARWQADELRCRAAEQLLRSGRIEEGLAQLGEVLTACGLHVPRSDAAALVSFLARRARLRARGLGYRPQPPGAASMRTRRRLDVCWTGSLGLSMVDPLRGADFGTRCLLIALDAGDEVYIARALAMDAAQLSSGGGATYARALALAQQASALAERLGDDHAAALAMLARGAAALMNGRWREAGDVCGQVEELARLRGAGLAWEIGSARTFRLTALYYLGEWSVMHERAEEAIRRARERGDLYTAAGLITFATYARLARDDVPGARDVLARATVPGAVRGYHVQRYLHQVAHLQVDLYDGQGQAAWARMSEQWPAMRRSLLARVQILRIEMAHFRARCALACAVADPAQAPALLRVARASARDMARERMPWSTPLAELVLAAADACSAEGRERAIERLERAVPALEAVDDVLFATAARRRLGELLGGKRGDSLVASANARMLAQGIASPAAVTRMLAPGFPAP
jgi:tetratricopeptide (TPR) repeat protein